jgi:DNA-binding transcriptional MocR family regulator
VLQARYYASLQVLCAALEEHCKGLAEWTVPRAGMFVWMKLNVCDDANELLDRLVADKVRTVRLEAICCAC